MAKDNFGPIDKLKVETLKPVYLLHGSEPYFIDLFLDKILDITIPDFEKGFNEVVLFGKDISVEHIIANVRKYPMMGDKQLVVVREAQQISDLAQKDPLDKLEKYVKEPLSSTIFVMAHSGDLDERKTWVKAFAQKGEILKFSSLYESEIPNFIQDYCKKNTLKISPKAVALLADHIGNNLSAIANELNKIKLNLGPNAEIDAKIIEDYVGISKEYNVFELQKALGQRNFKTSLKIFQYFSKNEKDNPMVVNLGSLFGYFTKVLQYHASKGKAPGEIAAMLKVNPYFLKDYEQAARAYPVGSLINIIRALHLSDQKSKGIKRGDMSDLEIYIDLLNVIAS